MVTKFLNIDTDNTLSANSNERVPSQKAVKTYTDNLTTSKQNKVLDTPITVESTEETTVEGALGAINTSLSNKQNQSLSSTITVDGTQQTTVEGTLNALNIYANSKQNNLTAGDNITINNNVISAKDTTYIAGTGISIDEDSDENLVISSTQSSAEWGNITGTLSNQADLQNALNIKQDILISGTNIKTVNGNSLLGSGNVDIDALPSQVGQNGKFLTTNGSAASWANVDALPSQTGNAGKYLTTDGSSASWDIPMAGLPLFYHTFQDHILNNSSWLRSDTFSWQSGSVYTSAYQHLVDDYAQSVPVETDVINGITIYFKRASDGHKVCHPNQESAISNLYNATGVVWYYILDTVNTRFKLPRSHHGNIVEKGQTGTKWYHVYSDGWCEQGGFEGNITPNQWISVTFLKEFADTNYTVVGSGVDPSISTATPDQFFSYRSPLQTTGFYGGIRYLSGGGTYADRGFSWYASGYVSSYPENSQYKYLYFYVGNTVQNQTTIDVGEITDALNGKVDLPTNKTQADVDYVVESYQNGTSWYRVYKSGWCEQGGSGANATAGTIQLLKEMADTNYSIMGFGGLVDTIGGQTIDAITTTSFSWSSYVRGMFVSYYWRVSGYATTGA